MVTSKEMLKLLDNSLNVVEDSAAIEKAKDALRDYDEYLSSEKRQKQIDKMSRYEFADMIRLESGKRKKLQDNIRNLGGTPIS